MESEKTNELQTKPQKLFFTKQTYYNEPLKTLRKDCFHYDEDSLDSNSAFFVVKTEDNETVACVRYQEGIELLKFFCISSFPSAPSKVVAFDRFCVSQPYRGSGLHRMLAVSALLQVAHDYALPHVWITLREGSPLRPYIERLGFQKKTTLIMNYPFGKRSTFLYVLDTFGKISQLFYEFRNNFLLLLKRKWLFHFDLMDTITRQVHFSFLSGEEKDLSVLKERLEQVLKKGRLDKIIQWAYQADVPEEDLNAVLKRYPDIDIQALYLLFAVRGWQRAFVRSAFSHS